MKKILCLILGLAGCGPYDRVTIDQEFTTEEVTVMKEVMEDLEVVTDSDEFHLTIAGEFFDDNLTLADWIEVRDVGRIWRVRESEPGYQAVRGTISSKGLRGATSQVYGSMLMVPSNISNLLEFRKVFTHELIHYFAGTDHLDTGIMSPGSSGFYCVDDRALRLLCENRECGPNAASNCVLVEADGLRYFLPERLVDED